MISPKDLYLEKLNMVYSLYESKLAMVGVSPRSSFSGVLETETGAQEAAEAQAAAENEVVPFSGGYNAAAELEVYRTLDVPGYGTGINAGDSTLSISADKAGIYTNALNQVSAQYGIPVSLLQAVIQAESSFNPSAVSSAGAQGLMQLMPGTAQGLGVENSFDALSNMEGGAKYLRTQLDRFGDVRLALAAYNYGPGRVEKLGVENANDPAEYEKLPEHLQKYVEKILHYEKLFAALQ